MVSVGIIMGSTSDYEVMKDACSMLDEFGVEYTPDKKVLLCWRDILKEEVDAGSRVKKALISHMA